MKETIPTVQMIKKKEEEEGKKKRIKQICSTIFTRVPNAIANLN